MRNKTLK